MLKEGEKSILAALVWNTPLVTNNVVTFTYLQFAAMIWAELWCCHEQNTWNQRC